MNALLSTTGRRLGLPRINDPLTSERANQLFRHDDESGKVFRKVAKPNSPAGSEVGWITNGYLCCAVDGRNYRLSRLIWLMRTGGHPAGIIDHIDGNRLNNRLSNLRDVTPRENARNRGAGKNSKTGIRGVCPSPDGGYIAFIGVDRDTKYLGRFQCIEDAKAERCRAELHWFGSFATDVSRYGEEAIR